MGTVDTSTLATATAYGNQRKIDRTQNGVLWSLRFTNGGQLFAYYSIDNGTTWTSGGGITGSSNTSYIPNGSIFIDVDDYAHVVAKNSTDGYLYYFRGTPNAARTAYTWSTATLIENAATFFDFPDVVAHRDVATSGAWAAHVVYGRTDSTTAGKAVYRPINITAGGSVTVGASVVLSANLAAANTNPGYVSIDFNHAGDGKTVAGGTPHLYVGWSAGAAGSGYGIRFRKATYSGGSWTWGTEREIDNTRYVINAGWLNCLFDGARVILAGHCWNGSQDSLFVYDRDAADTTTTTASRVLTGVSAAPASTDLLYTGSASYNAAGDVFFFGVDRSGSTGTRKVNSRKWTRATGTLEAINTVDATGADQPYVSARRGPQGQAIDYVYTDGTTSPHSVMSGRIVLNQNPTAPTPVSPADNATWDSATDQTVTLPYTDPDGNAASKVRVYYRPKGTSAPFSVIEQNTTAASGSNVNVNIPAGTWPGDIQYYGQFADSSGAWSDPGPTRTVTGIPAGLAALTGGGGGTAFSAWTIHNATENARIQRIGGRTALATIASTSPLLITVEGGTVSASRSAGYTPTQGDTVQADYVSGGWIVQDKIVQ